jgi:hypothetical protein
MWAPIKREYPYDFLSGESNELHDWALDPDKPGEWIFFCFSCGGIVDCSRSPGTQPQEEELFFFPHDDPVVDLYEVQ